MESAHQRRFLSNLVQLVLDDLIMVFAFASIAALLLSVSDVLVPSTQCLPPWGCLFRVPSWSVG